MRIFDCHAHLQSDRFDADRSDTISRARSAGVEYILNAATEPSDWDGVRALSRADDHCLMALGIHPWYIPNDAEEFLSSLSDTDFLGASAIGEIGLDSAAEKMPLERQVRIFEAQLALAEAMRLPSVIHCRAAFAELVRSADRIGISRGAVIHAFNGSEELAKELIRHGFDLSFGGVLTFKDSGKRARMLKSVYPDHFLLETDSPDIPVAGRKGTRNEPAFILEVIQAATSILGLSEEEVAETAFANARRLFLEK